MSIQTSVIAGNYKINEFIDETPNELVYPKITGGYPISDFYNNTYKKGGSKTNNGLAKFNDLAIPYGLVTSVLPNKKLHEDKKDVVPDVIDNKLFDKLFDSLTPSKRKHFKNDGYTHKNKSYGKNITHDNH